MHLIIISYHDNIITTGTMALVSLGSALFTINSTFGFLNGPMSWDSSRVSAAIPSGMCVPYTIFKLHYEIMFKNVNRRGMNR